MNALIRQEKESDYVHVFALIKSAFLNEKMSDHKEHLLVEKLRTSPNFIPKLSLVAEVDNTIVGHILLSKIKIKDGEVKYDSLALAPVSVHPEFQGKGIGSQLIQTAHSRARDLDHKSIILLGHENYYPRFGYQTLENFGISLPFEVPPQNCMALELIEHALESIKGVVEYDQAFYEN